VTIFLANLLTGAEHPAAFSANHLTDIDKTKHNNNQQHTNYTCMQTPTVSFTALS